MRSGVRPCARDTEERVLDMPALDDLIHAMLRTMSLGTAKPMPRLPCWPVLPVEICELTPITAPRALSSGPPELP